MGDQKDGAAFFPAEVLVQEGHMMQADWSLAFFMVSVCFHIHIQSGKVKDFFSLAMYPCG